MSERNKDKEEKTAMRMRVSKRREKMIRMRTRRNKRQKGRRSKAWRRE